ncbi:hypothetical protein [Burkholderia gladioli]|uniref:hypothetical protein n=1 Tax=Burkholderia gladioli TaxID=28095 RepID=UPI00163F586B|nr:hypothetical protein [Burkholderia gladioli]
MNLVQLADQPRLSAFHVACSLPRDPEFREWLRIEAERECDIALPPITPDEATTYIRWVCEITSRNELKNNPKAAHRFETLVRRPFVAWRRNQQH